MKYLPIFLILLIFSCSKNVQYQKQSLYEVAEGNSHTELLEERYFNDANEQVMTVIYAPRNGVFKSVITSENKDKKTAWISYSDSTLTNGSKSILKYDGELLMEQLYVFFSGDEKVGGDTVHAIYNHELNEDNKPIKSVISMENSAEITFVSNYNEIGKVATQSIINEDGSIQEEATNKYNEHQKIITRSINYPKQALTRKYYFEYKNDTLISKLSLQEEDTIRQEKYIYQKNILVEIKVVDQEEGTYKIVVENEMVNELPEFPIELEF